MVLIELGWLLINPLKRGHLYFVEKGTFLLCLDIPEFYLSFILSFIPEFYQINTIRSIH
jgi:hypothetical protein